MLGHPYRTIDLLLLGRDVDDHELRAHLRKCSRCRRYYDDGVLSLRAARRSLAAPGAGELERLMRRATSVAQPPPPRGLAWWVPAFAIVAALVLVVLAVRLAAPPTVPMRAGTVVSATKLTVDGAPAAGGAAVLEGQLLEAQKGDALVRLEGDRAVLLSEGAQLRLALAGAEVMLEKGSAQFKVKKGVGAFEVLAGTATISVKGTAFGVTRRGAETDVEVAEGVVEVRSRTAKVDVHAGELTTVSGEKVAPPRQLDFLERLKRGLEKAGRELDRAFDLR